MNPRWQPMAKEALVPLVVLVVTALALLVDLGGQNVWTKDEARDGLVARDIVERGHWLIPHLGGRVYAHKPPLFHWLVALSSPRAVTEWSLRFPSVMAAAGTAAVTYAIGARIATPAIGLVAAGILASSWMFVAWARMGRLEMVLVFWMTLAFWSAACWLDEGKRRHALVFGLALGCACLTKGPVGLVPLLAVVVAVTLLGRWSRRALTDIGLAVAFLVGLHVVWLGLAASGNADVGRYFEAVIAVFGNEMTERRHSDILYVPEAIGVGFLPWTLLVPGAVLILGRRWRTSWRLLLTPLLWAGLVLVIFGVFLSPRSVHFLPCYPALALLIAWAWATCSARERRWMSVPLAVGVMVIVVGGVVIAISPMTIGTLPRLTDLNRGLGLGMAAIAGAVAPGAWMLLRRHRANEAAMAVSVGSLLVMLLLQVAAYTPGVNRAYPTREVAARLAAALPNGAPVGYLDRKFTTGLMFYLPSQPVELPNVEALRGLVGDRHVALLLKQDELLFIRRRDACLPTRTLRAEVFRGDLYVLADVNGTPADGPPCRNESASAR